MANAFEEKYREKSVAMLPVGGSVATDSPGLGEQHMGQ